MLDNCLLESCQQPDQRLRAEPILREGNAVLPTPGIQRYLQPTFLLSFALLEPGATS